MADRNIDIPFGPDKTNGEGFSPIAPEESEAGLAQTPAGLPIAGTTPAQAQTPQQTASIEAQVPAVFEQDATQDSLTSASPQDVRFVDADEPALPAEDAQDDSGSSQAGGITEDEAVEQGLDDVQLSFAALRDSIGQSRELKAREKEHERLAEQLRIDREELEDRDNILVNYHALVAEQDAIIAHKSQKRDALKSQVSSWNNQIEQLEEQLENMRDYHNVQLEPFETALGRARASADQAKNDERSRKTELGAAEAELRRAEGEESRAMEEAKLQQVRAAHDEARARSEQAKEALEQAQKAYDDARDQAEQAEAPLERNLDNLTEQVARTKEQIGELGDEISVARKRRQYCDTVYQYPAETEKLRKEVSEAESVEMQMIADNKELRARLEQSKAQSFKAKVAIGIVIAIIILIIVSFIVVGMRAA